MAITLLGTEKEGVITWHGEKWWAEAGLIHVENVKGVLTVPVGDILKRMKALNDMIGNSTAHPDGLVGHTDQMQDIQNFIEKMLGLCAKAQRQGRPDDPKAIAQMRRDNLGHTRLHVMPGMSMKPAFHV